MTLRDYISKYCRYYPDPIIQIGMDGAEYLVEKYNAFRCSCGTLCIDYGNHKFKGMCVECAISEVLTDLIWEWLILKDGCNCFSAEKFNNTKPLPQPERYGHHSITFLKEVTLEAFKRFEELCGNYFYKHEYEFQLSLELGHKHSRYAKEYDKQEHIKVIQSGMKYQKGSYFDVLNKLHKELQIPRIEIPKDLVATEANINNLNRLIRQRKKQCQTNQ